jgi:uncharacterized small protein (DUF1192 family)
MSDQIDRLKAVIMQLAIEGSQYRVRDFGATELMMQSADEIERLRAELATKSDRIQELEDRISDRDIEILRLRTEHNARTASDEQEMEWLQSQLDKTDRRLAECRRLLREAMALTPWDFHAGTQAHDTWRQAARAAGGEDDA